MLINRLKNQRGDTIMEVLISMAVLSMVLTSAYVLANRSTQATRQAQERSESFKEAEGQMELFKNYITQSATPVLPVEGSKFCMRPDGTPTPAIPLPSSDVKPSDFQTAIDNNGGDSGVYGSCKKNELYYTYIERGTAGQSNTYNAVSRWNSIRGGEADKSSMIHRLYPDLASSADVTSTSPTACAPDQVYNSVLGCIPANTPVIRVVTQRIPPDANSTTPSCSKAGNASSGTSVRLSGNSVAPTASSPADFNNLGANPFGKTYTASLNGGVSGFSLCPVPDSTTTVTTTVAGSYNGPAPHHTLTLKLRPNCTSYYNSYYKDGARRSDLDNYYTYSPYPSGGEIPDNTYATISGQSGTYHFVYAGFRNGDNAKYFNLWETTWTSDEVRSCP